MNAGAFFGAFFPVWSQVQGGMLASSLRPQGWLHSEVMTSKHYQHQDLEGAVEHVASDVSDRYIHLKHAMALSGRKIRPQKSLKSWPSFVPVFALASRTDISQTLAIAGKLTRALFLLRIPLRVRNEASCLAVDPT